MDLWLKREEETGSYQAIQPHQKGPKPKIPDENRFRELIWKHKDKTQKQIAELWGEGVTQQNVGNACQKWGITRKKNLLI
ncbi:MAG: IS630 family transposase [Limnospira sp. PMC 1279.21]|uniref:IS630 family transposase n=1 Tax=Limnospira TaxID=2596745 RepID=UPI0002480F79|nr:MULTISPECIES: IS630 family transposase [unclassified Limnospira]MDT9189740.1 IS630 family transposase [Limnospira sp. PMC 894.15]MDT9220117.1 IS630 family transposase [Limnospira sp. PMC 1240.20]MDT9240808.1 IS630 family transposase [Limnospira sp. PMC 1261.20]MDT9246218.1 IS630 family transposase [Limnospira sp. PMC 1249.20]MDT9317547.1 IS630 family transposase [Limnospira sp. PMC 1306.21]MDT9327300.1 IS630 family transposase [Limnospira sp. PMC 1286.21]UWU47591.1 hypothetical protein AP